MKSALYLSSVVLSACILFASSASAQFTIPGAGGAVTISTSPAYPGANTPVTLTVQSGIYDVEGGDITWTANGKVIAQGIGATTARFTTGDIGEPTTISVNVSTDNGSASTALTVMPATVDLLWESDGYTPPFYRGRALPSAGSTVTIVALPHLVRSSGAAIPADQIMYTWKKDGASVASLSGRGKSSAIFDAPMLYGTETISVVAASADGAVSAGSSLRLSDNEPHLVLYEDTPLFGILYNRALPKTANISETEMAFWATPYFAPTRSLSNPQLEYTWSVNGSAVATDAKRPNEITINAERSSGLANIALQLTHASNFFLDVRGSWNVTLANDSFSGSSAGANDPFRR